MRLGRDFFARDALEVAPALVGKTLVRALPDGGQQLLLQLLQYLGIRSTPFTMV